MKKFNLGFIRKLFLSVSFLCLSGLVHSQIPKVRNFHKSQYNAANQNWAIRQTGNNNIYIANGLGLLEYDSNIWNLYPVTNYTDVRSLYHDETNERIYAGSFNDFGYYSKEPFENNITYKSLRDNIVGQYNEFTHIWNILKNGETFFFQGEKEVFKSVGDSIVRIDLEYKIDFSTVVHGILFISSRGNGLYMLNGDIFMKLPGSKILNDKRIVGMITQSNNDILIVTANNGIFVFNGENVRPFETDIDGFIKQNQVFSIAFNDKYIALGTVLNGVVIKERNNGINTFVNRSTGLQDNTVLSMSFDKDQNLWLGLNKGLSYIYINSPTSRMFCDSENLGSGYTSLLMNDKLFLGTNQGLFYVDYPIKSSAESVKPQLFSQMKGQVWFISEIDGQVFCGNDQGLFGIKGSHSNKIPGPVGTLKLIELKSSPGYLLGCSYHGFYILQKKNGKYSFLNYLEGVNETSGKIMEDKSGNIWFSHWQKGVFKFRISEDMKYAEGLTLYDSSKGLYNIKNAALSKVDNEIVVNTDGAFLKYDPESDKMVDNHNLNRIFTGHRSSVELFQSPDNSIWAISNDQIYYTKKIKKDLQGRNTKSVEEQSREYLTDSVSYKSLLNTIIPGFTELNFINNDNILISTEDGFSIISTDFKNEIKSICQLFIKNVIATNSDDTIFCGDNRQYGPDASIDFVKIKNHQNSLRFEFLMPEFREENSVEYSYMLEGFDNDWSVYNGKTYKEYTNIPWGKYTFHVRSHNKINSDLLHAAFKVSIEKPWYLSFEALIGYLVLLMLFVYMMVRLITVYSNRAARQMELKKEEEIKSQEIRFLAEKKEDEKKIVELKNQQLQFDLKHKSQDLANSTMNLIRKNEILADLNKRLEKVVSDVRKKYEEDNKPAFSSDRIVIQINNIRNDIRQNIEHDDDWSKFESNFDVVYEDYIKKISGLYPQLNNSDKKLCAILKMNLSSKDIAPLLNMSVRSVEMARYRLRKKMGLEREINLSEYLQNL